MPEIVTVDSEHGVILIKSAGVVSTANLSESLESVVQIVQKQGLKKVLVDATALQVLPPTGHLYDFASKISEQVRGMKHAVVISPHSPVGISDIELYAYNRGMNFKIFAAKDDALSWLNQ